MTTTQTTHATICACPAMVLLPFEHYIVLESGINHGLDWCEQVAS